MAPKSLAEQMAELEDLTPRDYDPEDLDRGNQDSDEEGAGAKDENAGREHYQAVGKAKLRKQDPISLGKQYAGSKVSRAALEADSDDDPFAARSESDSDSKPRKPTDDRDELRRLMATDQKTIAASISQAAKADAAKDLRVALADAHNTNAEEPKKRKRVDTDTPTATLWTRMTDLESAAITHRRTILDKWSAKVRGSTATTAANSRGKLLNPSGSGAQSITAVLDAQVATETGDHSRAAKRARQDTTTTTTTEGGATTPIYDDTVFYQSLLRDLVEQRMASSDAITNGLDTLHIQLPTRGGAAIHPVTGMRKDKVKRDVDTRASKGRKMRFDVHEKLQNFMAPEDRGSWTKHAREEFFASLLGKTASGLLREESGDEESGAESEEDREEGGLRLFRS
ncbi:hypothetical protein CAN33_0031675 [Aspergillus niger]|uniref:Protein BFR2 n=1 Tax=Aspergillus niger TaxID=5061 RepID=A0A505HV90_ASPNG|nr:hypothetical protein CAN33_0031675 [Aspergillus niger]